MDIQRAAQLLEECVFDPDACQRTFDAVADALDLRFFHLTNLTGPTPEHVTGERIHRALEEYVKDSVFERDEWTNAVTRRAPRSGQLLLDRDMVTEGARAGSSYYRDYCPRHDVAFHGGWANETETGLIHFAIFRSPSQGDFSQDDRQALERLIPVAGRAARLLVEARRARSVGLALGFEAAGQPCILVDHNGRVSFVTESAEALFDAHFGLRRGILWAADSDSNRRLAQVASVAQGRMSNALLPNLFIRREGRRPLILLLSPVRGLGLDKLPGARLVVSCIDLERAVSLDAQLLSEIYALTPSETDVAALLVNGASIAQIASARGVRESSARQAIKSILAKTETHRQAELIALLSKFVVTRHDRR